MKYLFVILVLVNASFYSNIISDFNTIVNFFSIKKDNKKNEVNFLDNLQEKVIKDSFKYEDSKTTVILGNTNSKIIVEEFVSPSCFGCKIFYKNFFNKLKKNYIDTNKIKYVVVEEYHNVQDFYANILLRCAKRKGGDNLYLKIKEVIFQKQNLWATTKEFKKMLTGIGNNLGITKEEYEECINDQNINHELLVLNRAISKKYSILATPALIINGIPYEEEKDIIKALDDLIDK
ncbi:MAG: thioredoxin domain-containing protein [Rickettsiales bacterium]